MSFRILIFYICSFLTTATVVANKRFVFRYDDYGIANDKISSEIFHIFEKAKIPLLVGIIPFHKAKLHNKNSDCIIDNSFAPDCIRLLSSSNFTIGMHGFCHKDISSIGVSEFNGIPFFLQNKMLMAGKKYLEQCFHTPISIFIPPWNAYDQNKIRALIKNQFKVISASTHNLPSLIEPVNIAFVPYTLTLNQLIYKQSDYFVTSDMTDDKLFIVMIHPYDFLEFKSKKGFITIKQFSNYLTNLRQFPNNSFPSINDVLVNEDFSPTRLQHNSINNSNLLPSCLHVSSTNYISANAINYIKVFSIVAPYFFYIGAVLTVFCFYLFLMKHKPKFTNKD